MKSSLFALFLLLAFFAPYAIAEAPATPKAAVTSWSRDGAAWNIEKWMTIYSTNGEKEIAFARAMAEQASASAKLQKAVRDKWGKDAEAAVAHALGNDTLEDDKEAHEAIQGDHAEISFEDGVRLDLDLIKVKGEWKVDVTKILTAWGALAPSIEKGARNSAKVTQSTARDLTDNKFKSSAELVEHLKKALDEASQ